MEKEREHPLLQQNFNLWFELNHVLDVLRTKYPQIPADAQLSMDYNRANRNRIVVTWTVVSEETS